MKAKLISNQNKTITVSLGYLADDHPAPDDSINSSSCRYGGAFCVKYFKIGKIVVETYKSSDVDIIQFQKPFSKKPDIYILDLNKRIIAVDYEDNRYYFFLFHNFHTKVPNSLDGKFKGVLSTLAPNDIHFKLDLENKILHTSCSETNNLSHLIKRQTPADWTIAYDLQIGEEQL